MRGRTILKFGEFAGLGINLDRPAMLLDNDIVTDGQAEPSPFSGRLRCEEGIEQLLLHFGGMPVPLSRILISTLSPRFLVAAVRVGS